MRGWKMSLAATTLVVAAGCASQRSSQELARLRADVGLLDQRVGQLERTSVRDSSLVTLQKPTPMPSESSAPTPAAASDTAWTRPSKTQIQQALKNAGLYQGPVDGKLGPASREAIREFQRTHSLTV